MGLIANLMDRSKKDLTKDRIELLHSEIKRAYQSKIDEYRDLLKHNEIKRKELLDFHSEENNIKKLDNFSVSNFMSQVERLGIAEMNHQTVLDMLTKQYKDWFDEEPK